MTIHDTYAKLREARDTAAAAMRQFPKLPNGMTPDAVKATPEWREAYRAYHRAALAAADFYGAHRRELDAAFRAERAARRGQFA